MVEGAENSVVRNAEVRLKLTGTYSRAAVQQLPISPHRVTHLVEKYCLSERHGESIYAWRARSAILLARRGYLCKSLARSRGLLLTQEVDVKSLTSCI